MNIEQSQSEGHEIQSSTNEVVAYESPAVESVLTPDSLEREVHYAGVVVGSNPTPL